MSGDQPMVAKCMQCGTTSGFFGTLERGLPEAWTHQWILPNHHNASTEPRPGAKLMLLCSKCKRPKKEKK